MKGIRTGKEIPQYSFGLEIYDDGGRLVGESFNCWNLKVISKTLRDIADRLDELQREANHERRTD